MADKSWKAQAMRSLGDEQRRMLLADLARRIVDLRMQQATNRLSATSELLAARRALARLKTILHE
ncbi:MAG: 50S ribosomal protein L29, partial [Gemmataceae bacterium]